MLIIKDNLVINLNQITGFVKEFIKILEENIFLIRFYNSSSEKTYIFEYSNSEERDRDFLEIILAQTQCFKILYLSKGLV